LEEIEIKKIKNKKYHIVGKNLNSKRKIAERGQIDTLSTQIQYMTSVLLRFTDSDYPFGIFTLFLGDIGCL
jgi:hypothetical protein